MMTSRFMVWALRDIGEVDQFQCCKGKKITLHFSDDDSFPFSPLFSKNKFIRATVTTNSHVYIFSSLSPSGFDPVVYFSLLC